jgi:Large polyvalent protein associated domain 23
MEWTKVIEDPAFSGLSTSEQNEIRQHWVDTVFVPQLQESGIPEEDIPGARYEALARYDNGQGYVSSFAASTAQGLLGLGTSAIQGAGVLVDSPSLEGVGTGLQESVQENFTTNPVLDKTNFTGQVAGNVLGFLGTAGAGGAVGKSLGAARAGAEIGGLGTGFLAGTGQGAQEADQYGITGDERYLRALGGGLTEVLSEKIPFLGGLGSELRAVSKIPGLGALATPAAGGLVKAVGSEIVEENIANTTGNLLTSALAPDGVATPGMFEGALEATAGGALGGAMFGGIGMIGRTGPEAAADTAAANAEALLEATGDPAAAEVIRQANATRPAPPMVPVEPPMVAAAKPGDSSVGDLLVPPQEMDLAAFAEQGVPVIEEPEAVFDATGGPFVLPPEIQPTLGGGGESPVAVLPETPAVPAPVAPAPATPAPTTPAAPQFTPEQIRQMAVDDQLIDVNGRIDANKATSIFNALKDLGVTKANLVINETGVSPEETSVPRARGQRTMFGGQDTIFLNKNEVTLDTPLHEVVHGLIPEMRTSNRALFDQGAAILQNSPLADAIRRRYEAQGQNMDPDTFMEEVMTTAVANNGAELIAAYAGNGAMVRAIKEWLAKIRVWLEEFMGSKGIDPNMTVGEFSAKVNRRILAGKLKEGAGAGGFSFAGQVSDIDEMQKNALVTAKAMQQSGRDPEEIRKVTGWFPGKYDGKMRYEVPDQGMSFRAKWGNAVEEMLEYARARGVAGTTSGFGDRVEILPFRKWGTDEVVDPADYDLLPMYIKDAKNPKYAAEKFFRPIKNRAEKGNPMLLGELIDHPELFKAYPSFRAIKVEPFREGDDGAAHWDPSTNTIRLNPNVYDVSESSLKDSIIHEVQHAIQGVEDFGRGASPVQFDSAADERYRMLSEEFDKEVSILNDAWALAKHIETQGGSMVSARAWFQGNRNRPPVEKASAVAAGRSSDELADEVEVVSDRYAALLAEAEKGTRLQQYMRVPGEIEARDVAIRRDMSESRRASTPPYSSQNIPVEDAVTTDMYRRSLMPSYSLAGAPSRFDEMLAREDARRAAAAGDTPYRIDGVQKGYESEADDAPLVPKFQNVTIVDPTHPFNGSSLSIPVNGRPVPLTDAQIREAIEAKRNQRFSLNSQYTAAVESRNWSEVERMAVEEINRANEENTRQFDDVTQQFRNLPTEDQRGDPGDELMNERSRLRIKGGTLKSIQAYPNGVAIDAKKYISDFQELAGDDMESRRRWKRGAKVRDDERVGDVYAVTGSGVLFRGISREDYDRIIDQGFMDTDGRAAIVPGNEGMNLTPSTGTAFAYFTPDTESVIVAIDTEGLPLNMIGGDDYIRSFEPIPADKIIAVSDPVLKHEYDVLRISRSPALTDENDQLVPLSERVDFQTRSRKPVYSLASPATQAIYMDLAQDPETNEDRLQEIVNQVADEAGYTIEGNHGTTHTFTVFDVSRGNIDNNLGRGIYLTNNEDDVTENYAGEGPDLTNRIEALAEKIQQDEDEDGESISEETARELARQQLFGGTPRVIKARIRMLNPVILDGRGSGRDGTTIELSTPLDNFYDEAREQIISENPDTDPEELEDEIIDRQYELRDSSMENSPLDKIRNVVDRFDNTDSGRLMEALQDQDEIKAWELERELRENEGTVYATDYYGEMAVGELIQDVFEALGFDGIIDRNVSSKFGSDSRSSKPMTGVDYDTEHYIVRDSAQVKSSAPVEYDDQGNIIPLEQRFDPNKRDIRFSLMRPTGLAANQPGSPVRAMVAGMSYRGESFGPVFDQAYNLYMDVERRGGGYDAHLAQFNSMLGGNEPGVMNMTPGAYWGIMFRALTDVIKDPNSDAMMVEEANRHIQELSRIGVNITAQGGQFIKGFDGGLRIANNAAAQVDMEDKMAPFDGSQERRKEFDAEKAAVEEELDSLTTDAIDNLTEDEVTRKVSEALADVAKGEDTSIAAEVELNEELSPEIIAAEEAAEVSGGWLADSIGKLNSFLTKTSDKIIYHLQVLNGLQNLNGLFSLPEGELPPPDVQKVWDSVKTKAERDALIKSTKAEIARLTKEITEIKSIKVSDAEVDDSATAEGMARQRITDNLERLLSPKAKKKLKVTESKIAAAISSALLSKAGLGGKQPGGADNMTFAMGLLLANQDKAATVLQQVHDIIQGDPETYDDISREKLKSFIEMTIGRTFDTAEGATKDAAPYGEKQIAQVLRSELKRMKVSMTKVAKDAAMARQTAAELEKALRDPKRGYASALSPEALDRVVGVVLAEYTRTAAERTQRYQQQEQLAADERETRDMVKAAAKESRSKRAAVYRQEYKKARAELREAEKETAKEVSAAAKESRQKRARTIRMKLKAIRKEISKANRESRSAVTEAATEARRKKALAIRVERRKRQKARRDLVKEIRAARAVGGPVPDLTPLNYNDAQEMLKQKPGKVIDYLAREFGFDLAEVVRTVRGTDRQSTVEAMTVKLASDLNLSKAQAQAMMQPIITEAMKSVDARRKKEAETRIEAKVKSLSGRTIKKGGPTTEAQRLIRLAELGGLSSENVEKVMLNSMGAKQFSPEFKADLERVIEQSNDPNLPQAARDERTATYLGMIKSARGVYAAGLLGEWTMSNIFMNLLSTMKVNAVWGGIKVFADNVVYLSRFDPFNTLPGAKIPKGARAALLQALRRGYTKDLQYQAKYIFKTGRSKLESDYTTQFSNSDFETLAHFPETEIRLWQEGKPLSPFWAAKVRLLTNFSKYTRRVMVGTDIFHRTPAYEMIKANAIIKLIHEKGGDIPNTPAAWKKAVDDAMYGGDFEAAKKDAFKQADKLLADGKISKDEYGVTFGEIMDNKMGVSLGMTDAQRKEMLDGAAEQAKRWTVANATEGLLGGLSNSMLNAVREIPGLKFLMPAIRMPIGAFSQGLDWSPYGFLRAQAIKWNKGKSSSVTNYIFNRDGARRTWNLPAGGVTDEQALDLRNKAMFGTAMMVALYLLAKASEDEDEDKAGFYITGKGPEDVNKNKLWREKGNQPFTIRVNGKYSIRFQESPAFPVLAALGAWSDANRYAKAESTQAEKYYYAIIKGMSSFGDAAVLKNLQDVVEVATGGQSSGRGVDKAVNVTTRLGGLVLFPRVGQEVNNILYGPQDNKAGGWAARLFSNVPFTPSLFGKPALNFFGEVIHEDRGGPMGEIMPMVNHRVTAPLTDDPQMLFVARMGANPLSTTRRFKDGTAVREDYDFMREWQTDSGRRTRQWLTPAVMERLEQLRARDVKTAEDQFDKELREIREQSLKSISKGRIIF